MNALSVMNSIKSKELNINSLLQDAHALSKILQQAVQIVRDFEMTTFPTHSTNGSDYDIDRLNYNAPVDPMPATINNEPIVTKESDKTLQQSITPVVEEEPVDTSKLVFPPDDQEMRRLLAYTKCCHPDISLEEVEANATFSQPIENDEIRELFEVYVARYYGISVEQFYSLRKDYFSQLTTHRINIYCNYGHFDEDVEVLSNSSIGYDWRDLNLKNDNLSNFDLTACNFSNVEILQNINLSNANLSLATIKTRYTEQLITFGDICRVVDFSKPEGRDCYLVIDNLGQKVVFAGCFWDTLDEFERHAKSLYRHDPIAAYEKRDCLGKKSYFGLACFRFINSKEQTKIEEGLKLYKQLNMSYK